MNWEERRVREVYDKNFAAVYRICLIYMKNREEALDMTQETFVRLLQKKEKEFREDSHAEAWLRVTACNLCKNELRHWWKRKRANVEETELLLKTEEEDGGLLYRERQKEVLAALLALPEKYRILIYFHYYEEYQVKELGELLGENPSTLRSRLAKGKELLKEKLKEAGIHEADSERFHR